MRVRIINGPNLNNIGIREPDIYGKISFSSFLDKLKMDYSNYEISYFYSHVEGDLVTALHESNASCDAVVLNAGAYSHTSVAIRDAVAAISVPVVMVHISNVYNREKFRQTNIVASVCKGVITGFGLDSYRLAIESLK
jgi:3-dehydroquinate dehydratase II